MDMMTRVIARLAETASDLDIRATHAKVKDMLGFMPALACDVNNRAYSNRMWYALSAADVVSTAARITRYLKVKPIDRTPQNYMYDVNLAWTVGDVVYTVLIDKGTPNQCTLMVVDNTPAPAYVDRGSAHPNVPADTLVVINALTGLGKVNTSVAKRAFTKISAKMRRGGTLYRGISLTPAELKVATKDVRGGTFAFTPSEFYGSYTDGVSYSYDKDHATAFIRGTGLLVKCKVGTKEVRLNLDDMFNAYLQDIPALVNFVGEEEVLVARNFNAFSEVWAYVAGKKPARVL